MSQNYKEIKMTKNSSFGRKQERKKTNDSREDEGVLQQRHRGQEDAHQHPHVEGLHIARGGARLSKEKERTCLSSICQRDRCMRSLDAEALGQVEFILVL